MTERLFLEAVHNCLSALEAKDYRKALYLVDKAGTSFEIDYDCNDEVMNAAARLGEINCEALSMLNQHDEAIRQGLVCVKQYPKRWEGPLTLARAFQRARMLEDARKWCGKAYTLNPKTSTIRLTMMAIETDIKIEQSNAIVARSGSLGNVGGVNGGAAAGWPAGTGSASLADVAVSADSSPASPTNTFAVSGSTVGLSASASASTNAAVATPTSTLVVPPIARAMPKIPIPAAPTDEIIMDVVKTAVEHSINRPKPYDEAEGRARTIPPLLPPAADVSIAVTLLATVFGATTWMYSTYPQSTCSNAAPITLAGIPRDVYAGAILATAVVLTILRIYGVCDTAITTYRIKKHRQQAIDAVDAKAKAAVSGIMEKVSTPRSGAGKVAMRAQQNLNAKGNALAMAAARE